MVALAIVLVPASYFLLLSLLFLLGDFVDQRWRWFLMLRVERVVMAWHVTLLKNEMKDRIKPTQPG